MEISENIVVNDTISAASTKRSNPWGKTPSVVPCSLAAVMDEEVAKEMQAQEDYLAGYHLQSSAASSQETFEGIYYCECIVFFFCGYHFLWYFNLLSNLLSYC